MEATESARQTPFFLKMVRQTHPTDTSLFEHLKNFHILGVFPVDFESFNFDFGSPKTSKRFVAISLFVILLNTALFIISLYQHNTRYLFLTETFDMMGEFLLLVQPPSVAFCLYRNRSILNNAVQTISNHQWKLSADKYRLFTAVRNMIVFITTLVSANAFVRVLFLSSQQYQNPSGLYLAQIEDTIWVTINMYLTTVLISYSYLILCAGQCFARLSKTSFAYPKVTSKFAVTEFIHVYKSLSDCCKKISSCYDGPIGCSLVHIFTVTFSVILKMQTQSPNIFQDIILYMRLLSFSFRGLYLIYCCETVAGQAEECNKALLSYIIHDKSEVYQDNPLVMIHLSSRKPLQFTACKCVNVDYRLGLSMIAAFLTYIVVLFQIENPNNGTPTTTIAPTHSTFNATSA